MMKRNAIIRVIGWSVTLVVLLSLLVVVVSIEFLSEFLRKKLS